MLKYEYLVAKFGVDTAENERRKVSRKCHFPTSTSSLLGGGGDLRARAHLSDGALLRRLPPRNFLMKNALLELLLLNGERGAQALNFGPELLGDV